MAVWQRLHITQIVFEQIKYLQTIYNIDAFIVYSEPYWESIIQEHGFKGTYAPNQPLGRKHNIGMQECLKHEWDYVIQCGSDDLIHEKLFQQFNPDIDVNGVNYCYAIDMNSGKVGHVENEIIIGAGRMFKRNVIELFTDNVFVPLFKVLFKKSGIPYGLGYIAGATGLVSYEKMLKLQKDNAVECLGISGKGIIRSKRMVNYRFVEDLAEHIKPYPELYFWDEHLSRGLDTNSSFRCESNGFKSNKITGTFPYIVDLKTDININCFDAFNPSQLSLNKILEFFPVISGKLMQNIEKVGGAQSLRLSAQ